MTIWVNGCFDIIHPGHIALLEYAKSLGDRLVVGLDTDERVKQNKGSSRPINSLSKRTRVMSAIRFVDEVVSFGSEEELLDKIASSKAELIVVGNDYEGKRVIGSEIVPVNFFRKIDGLSSTDVINAIRF